MATRVRASWSRLMSMVFDPVTTSLTVFKWFRELPETIKAWKQFRPRYPAVSIVRRQNAMYHEATQTDGTIVTQIMLDCLITNGLEDRWLLVARTECHVRWRGTVVGIPVAEKLPPTHP